MRRSTQLAPPLVVCGIVLSLVTGCPATKPSEPGEDPDAAREAMAARVLDFCRGYMSRQCQRELECTGTLEADVCHPEMQEVRCQALRQATRAGRLDFVASEADGCMAQLEGACHDLPKLRREEPINNDRICPSALQGLSPRGGACATWEECAQGTYCTARGRSNDQCPGLCMPFSQEQCAPGQYLLITLSIKGCFPAFEIGEKCGFLPPTRECVAGAYCGDSSRCEAQLAEGASCTRPNQCREGLTCAGAEGARTCRPLKPVGAACTVGWNECSRGVGVTCMGGRCAMPHAGDACNNTLSSTEERAGCFDSSCSSLAETCMPWGSTARSSRGCGPSHRWTDLDENTGTVSCPGACAPPP